MAPQRKDAAPAKVAQGNKRSSVLAAPIIMKPLTPRLRRFPLIAPVFLTSLSAVARETQAPELTPTAPDATSEAAVVLPAPQSSRTQLDSKLGPVFVSVASEGYDVSASEVASAIVRELNVALTSSANLARGTFLVELTRGKDLSVTFRDTAGNELKRVVKAPANDDQVSEVAALLAVNLSQDESSKVLADLTPEQVVPTAPPQPETAALPVSAPHLSERPPPPSLPPVAVNATFVHPLTTMRDVDERTVGFEFGLLYSRLGALDGFALNAVLANVRYSSNGFMLAGIGSVSGTPEYTTSHDVVRIGGAFNYGHGPLTGLSISGAVDVEVVPESAELGLLGAQVAGAANVVTGSASGAQIGGVVNYATNTSGMQLAGAANIANGNMNGAQIGGATNVALGNLDGAQFAGALNIAEDVQGVQIGLVNIGKRVSGAQIGVINIAEEVDGASVGLITYSKKGQTQITTWFDPTRPINVGARFVSGPLYAMPTVGGDPSKTDEFDFGFSLGARIPVERVYFDLESNFSNHFRDNSVDESNIDLRHRAAVGYQVLPWLGIFAGGGVRHQFHAKDGGDHRLTGLWNVGIDLL